MRELCPICGKQPIDSFDMNFEVPDSWPLPKHNQWLLCSCGFVWLFNHATEDNYNEYYLRCYIGANFNSEPPHRERLWGMAEFISKHFDSNISIVDFGGGDGVLGRYLKEYKFNNYMICDVGQSIPPCDLIVASHVIEHIYDLNKMTANFAVANTVLAEVPEALAYSYRDKPAMLDYQTQHINHFGVSQLDRLFSNYGFSCEHREISEFPLLNMPTYRAIYKKNGYHRMFDRVKSVLDCPPLHTDKPVIVWGLGDYAMWVLANNNIGVSSFVDLSKQYRGMTIMGKPILDHVEGDDPILVIARGKQKEIVEYIKSLGIKNEVIVV
jgi:hypothetical protein